MCGAGCEPQSRRKMWGGGSRTEEQDAWGPYSRAGDPWGAPGQGMEVGRKQRHSGSGKAAGTGLSRGCRRARARGPPSPAATPGRALHPRRGTRGKGEGSGGAGGGEEEEKEEEEGVSVCGERDGRGTGLTFFMAAAMSS